MTDPIRPTDAEGLQIAQTLIAEARHAALATVDADGHPFVSRIALARDGTQLFTLISTLAAHTRHLRDTPKCALMLGEPGAKGDALTHPRLSLTTMAEVVERGSEEHAKLRAACLKMLPKTKLYIDFPDFSFARFAVLSASLNGGFGKAYLPTPSELGLN